MSTEYTDLVAEEIDAVMLESSISNATFHVRLSSPRFSEHDVALLEELKAILAQHEGQIGSAILVALSSQYPDFPVQSRKQANLLIQQIQLFDVPSINESDYRFVRARISACMTLEHIGFGKEHQFFIFNKYQSLLSDFLKTFCDGDLERFHSHINVISKLILFHVEVICDIYAFSKSPSYAQQDATDLHPDQRHDPLSDLPNQTMLRAALGKLIENAREKEGSVALIKLSLDHFDQLNISDGEHIGGQIVQQVSIRLQQQMTEDDFLAYAGNNSFYLILSKDVTNLAIERRCGALNMLVRAPLPVGHKNIQISCSMGIALFPQDQQNPDGLLKCADSTMLHAMEAGGNRHEFFNQEIDRQRQIRSALANELFHAIEDRQFELHYQPVIDLQTGQLASMEALIRWNHPNRGVIPPIQFISVAEDLSLIIPLGAWVIRQACADISAWLKAGMIVPRIAINVSPKQLQETDFTQNLLDTLNSFGVSPGCITLEITESLFLKHNDQIEITLKQIHQHGFALSMDDFGTGYSALSYLKHYPFDYVKIDRSFVHDIIENPDDAAIANAIISMTHSMGIKVIAEGVETEAQCDYLTRNMCDFIQGYYVSRPMPAAAAQQFMARNYQLPVNLKRFYKTERTLLLVDDEPNILSSLKRLLRQDGYQILTATSGQQGLEVIEHSPVDVIISDQRMPEMTGVEFLRIAKQICPETIRIVLSGYTELQSITDAINEGAIYKFLTKPWDDAQFREQIAEAFRQKEMSDENRLLGLKIKTTNQELANANRQLQETLQLREKQINLEEISLDVAREALHCMPIPFLGVDDNDIVAFVNQEAETLLSETPDILGADINAILPDLHYQQSGNQDLYTITLSLAGLNYLASVRMLGKQSNSGAKLITFLRTE
ncbi:diguanylate cyclase (GGDEF)-like protein [Oxalobacteraceae bacterium GrIS 1.18]